MQYYQGHLKRQLSFIERSCQAFDNGFLDESIRIATSIRVLLHNTPRSTSLLSHLNALDVELMTSCSPVGEGVFFFMGLGEWNLRGPVMELRPSLSPTMYPPLPANEWWNQVVFILFDGTRITRRNIVLAAANKDGGAHVDQKLTAEYNAISQPGSLGTFYHRGDNVSLGFGPAGVDEVAIGVPDSHFVSLRQMGYELLHSPALLALAND